MLVTVSELESLFLGVMIVFQFGLLLSMGGYLFVGLESKNQLQGPFHSLVLTLLYPLELLIWPRGWSARKSIIALQLAYSALVTVISVSVEVLLMMITAILILAYYQYGGTPVQTETILFGVVAMTVLLTIALISYGNQEIANQVQVS